MSGHKGAGHAIGFLWCVILAIGLFISTTADASAEDSMSVPPPFVMALYMHCYVLGAQNPSDPRVRNPTALDNLQNWPPIAEESEWFNASDAAMAASGASATKNDFEKAETAGVNAFTMLLGPHMLPSSAYSNALNLLASVAQHQKVNKLFGQHVKAFLDAHPGAFQSRDGKPMFALEFDNLSKHLSSSDQALLSARVQEFLAPWGGLAGTYTIMYVPWDVKQGLEVPLLAKANALSIWTPQDDWSALHSHIVVDLANSLHKKVAWPVSPSFYQRRAGGGPMEYGNGFGVAKYIDAWLKVLDVRPEFVDIQTWNDFSEGTAIRPTNATDETLLDLTKYLHQWVERGSQPPITMEQLMLFHPKQLVKASLDDPTALVTNAAWRHKTPTVDYLDLVTFLKEDAVVRVTLGKAQWQETVPAGFHEWIIYAPQPTSPQRPGEVIAGPDSYPAKTPMRSVTLAQPFSEGTPQVQVERRGRVLPLTSKAPYLARGQFQDFTVIGDTVSWITDLPSTKLVIPGLRP
jgi:hypothetical protein